MSERPAPYRAGHDHLPPDVLEAAIARYRAESDPRLLELLDNARRAFDELAAYMAAKCEEAGVELPTEWRALASRKGGHDARTIKAVRR